MIISEISASDKPHEISRLETSETAPSRALHRWHSHSHQAQLDLPSNSQAKWPRARRGQTQLNEWWLPLLPLQQTGRIVLTRVRAKQNLQHFYTLRSSWPNKCQGKSFLVKGLMTKSDTMLIGILVDLEGPKQVFPSCHFTCSNLANW